jgi:hypothetical protein
MLHVSKVPVIIKKTLYIVECCGSSSLNPDLDPGFLVNPYGVFENPDPDRIQGPGFLLTKT